MAAKEIKLDFTQERETKNTIRFEEEPSAAHDVACVDKIYIRKEWLADLGDPNKIEVIIRERK